jgi:hypothetical protein
MLHSIQNSTEHWSVVLIKHKIGYVMIKIRSFLFFFTACCMTWGGMVLAGEGDKSKAFVPFLFSSKNSMDYLIKYTHSTNQCMARQSRALCLSRTAQSILYLGATGLVAWDVFKKKLPWKGVVIGLCTAAVWFFFARPKLTKLKTKADTEKLSLNSQLNSIQAYEDDAKIDFNICGNRQDCLNQLALFEVLLQQYPRIQELKEIHDVKAKPWSNAYCKRPDDPQNNKIDGRLPIQDTEEYQKELHQAMPAQQQYITDVLSEDTNTSDQDEED